MEPLHVACSENAWYLLCYDLHRKTYRTLLLSRMRKLKRTGRKFEKLLENSTGIYKGAKPERVRPHARGFATRLLTERSWHASQRVEELPGTDGREVEVTIKVTVIPKLEH